ncbi:MAG TPA: hypothetical protein VI076_09260 [Actinopolymorphaceae bacterium]
MASTRESPGNTLWVTTGLHLESVPSDQLTGLKNRFLAEYDPDGELAGFDFPDVKAPDVTWTTYGLLEKGMLDQAQGFVDVLLRDMVRSGEFAEVYERGPDGLRGTGVRPSLFGAVNVVDVVWLPNGYRMDAGDPRFVLMPGERGGIRGLRFGNRTLDVDIDATSGKVRLGGSLVRATPSCRTLELPLGRTAGIPESCRATR